MSALPITCRVVKLMSNRKPGFPEGHEWPHGGSSSSSNSTKIKEREAHHGCVSLYQTHARSSKLMSNRKPWDGHGFPPHGPPTSTNTTKLKERQHGAPHGPPGGDEYPPYIFSPSGFNKTNLANLKQMGRTHLPHEAQGLSSPVSLFAREHRWCLVVQ